jgi:hypothetical protein
LWIVIVIAAAFFLFAFGGTGHVAASTVVDPTIDAATIPAADTIAGDTADLTLPGAIEISGATDVTFDPATTISDVQTTGIDTDGVHTSLATGVADVSFTDDPAVTNTGDRVFGTSWRMVAIGIAAAFLMLASGLGLWTRRRRRHEGHPLHDGSQHLGQPVAKGRVTPALTSDDTDQQGAPSFEREGTQSPA